MYSHPQLCSALDLALLRATQIFSGQLARDAWLHRVVLDRRVGWGAEIRLDSAQHFSLHFTRRNPTDRVLWDVLEHTSTAFADALGQLVKFVSEYHACEQEHRAELAKHATRDALAAA